MVSGPWFGVAWRRAGGAVVLLSSVVFSVPALAQLGMSFLHRYVDRVLPGLSWGQTATGASSWNGWCSAPTWAGTRPWPPILAGTANWTSSPNCGRPATTRPTAAKTTWTCRKTRGTSQMAPAAERRCPCPARTRRSLSQSSSPEAAAAPCPARTRRSWRQAAQ